MRRLVTFAGGALMALTATAAYAEPISISEIIQLSTLKMGDDAIIAKIKSAENSFDLTTDQMIDLKQKGVSSAVIAAMLEKHVPIAAPSSSLDSPDPAVLHPPGLYLLTGDGDQAKMAQIDPLSANQMKTGGIIGYALTGGIASASIKVAIPNSTARLHAKSQPIFYFFFDASQARQQNSSFLGSTFGASSPGEFSLVTLTAKSGRREARVGSMNIAGAKMGVMDKDRVQFDYILVRPGVYTR